MKVCKMMEKEFCSSCGQKLRARESNTATLVVCINPRCDNYWVNKGSEIIMMLK
jgi:predicted RNA-binding Zn-ribbon protein involved in translation (DUF1610 family)